MNIIDTTKKKKHIPMILIIIFFTIMGLSGCSSDDPIINTNGTVPDADKVLSTICTDWFSSSTEVDKKMKGLYRFLQQANSVDMNLLTIPMISDIHMSMTNLFQQLHYSQLPKILMSMRFCANTI